MGSIPRDIKQLKKALTCEIIDTCVRTGAIRKRIIPRALEFDGPVSQRLFRVFAASRLPEIAGLMGDN